MPVRDYSQNLELPLLQVEQAREIRERKNYLQIAGMQERLPVHSVVL
jgi:hypothetical protein